MATNNKSIYLAATSEENGKYYSYVIKTYKNYNLLTELEAHKRNNLIHANICNSKKEAYRLVEFWNNCYKENGTYLFYTPSF